MTALLVVLAGLRWRAYTFVSWDNAIFTQSVRAYSELRAPVVDVKEPDYLILGDHFSPVTALLAPFFAVFPSGFTLLVAQAVLCGLSVVVITRVAVDRLGVRDGMLVGVLYGTSFGVVRAVPDAFHEVAFAAPLLALAGAAFLNKQYARVVWWTLPLLLVKEDLGMTVAAVGVALWLVGERRRGVLLAVVGVVATVLVVAVLIPLANTSGQYDYTGTLGGEVGVLATLGTAWWTKLGTVLVTLGVGGLVCVRSPWIVLVVPTLAWRFVGDVPYYWETGPWHYSLVLMPVVFVALLDAVERHPRSYRTGLLVAVAFAGLMFRDGPVDDLFRAETWRTPAIAAQAREVLDTVPRDAVVASDLGLLSHLAADRELYWTGTVGDVVPEWVVLDARVAARGAEEWAEETWEVDYTTVLHSGPFTVARLTTPEK